MPSLTTEIIGSLAAILTTTSFVPQVVRTIRTRDTHAISLWMYLLFSSGVALWAIYGILLGSWPIVVANGLTFALAASVLLLKVREKTPDRAGSADREASRCPDTARRSS